MSLYVYIDTTNIMSTKYDTEFMMFFHTTLRNIGLFTTLSMASLAYGRTYRKHIMWYDVFLILVSLGFLSIAMFINYRLFSDTKDQVSTNKDSDMLVWVNIPEALFFIHATLFSLGTITLLRISIL